VLTWKEGKAFRLNPWTMEITDELTLEGEGWGLCLVGEYLYQSNGSANLLVRDPDTFAVLGTIAVSLNGQPQYFLNELEYAYGCILANQWQTSRILFINPGTGEVDRVINLREATPIASGVMNGLALKQDGTLLCSGKNWPLTLVLDGIE
jgi:glutamine cyclotransferase